MAYNPTTASRARFIHNGLEPLVCPICQESYDDNHFAVQVSDNPECSHVFGKACIQNWAHSTNAQAHRCPMCRALLFNPALIDEHEFSGDDPPHNTTLDEHFTTRSDLMLIDGHEYYSENFERFRDTASNINFANPTIVDHAASDTGPLLEVLPDFSNVINWTTNYPPRTANIHLTDRQIQDFGHDLWYNTWILVGQSRSTTPDMVGLSELYRVIEDLYPYSPIDRMLRSSLTRCAYDMIDRHTQNQNFESGASLSSDLSEIRRVINPWTDLMQ